MPTLIGLYLFLLGLACGITLLTITAYRQVSPQWLKWLLMATGAFVLTRYLTMAIFTSALAAQFAWGLRYCWFATSIGLTLPSVIAIDQLLRHPAMSPQKLLRMFAPFAAVYTLIILIGPMAPRPDPVAGWMVQLVTPWQWILSAVQAMFVIGFITICLMLMRKIPSKPIRRALLGLALAHAYLGFDGVMLALGRWYFRPFLFSEIFALLAIWYAYDTSAQLQRSTS